MIAVEGRTKSTVGNDYSRYSQEHSRVPGGRWRSGVSSQGGTFAACTGDSCRCWSRELSCNLKVIGLFQ